MAEMVTIRVDNRTVEAQKGSLLIDVLLQNQVNIPHFCYHEALGADGNCRMCMVEIKGSKRPQIACDTFVKAGMEVSTQSDSIQQVKRSILELELVNHPVDCPVCDQAGECKLQDYYMDFGLYESRLDTPKTRKGKHIDLGSNVMLDQERCVLCARCTRFTQEITRTHELAIIGRGDHACVSTAPGHELHNPYAMNVVDLCPVGALTSKDFRFRQRVWFLESIEGVCHGCAKGCNIWIDHNRPKYAQDRIYRFRPRINAAVNGHFLCDEGRLSYKSQNEQRAATVSASGEPVSPEEAVTTLREQISLSSRTVALSSASLSLEQLAAVATFCEKNSIDLFSLGEQDPSFGDDWLRQSDRSANSASAALLGINSDEEAFREALEGATLAINFNHPLLMESLPNKNVITFSDTTAPDETSSTLLFPFAPYAMDEGSLINCDARLQRFKRSLQQEDGHRTLLQWLHLLDETLPQSSEEAWQKLLHALPPLASIDYRTIPPEGITLKGEEDA